MKRQITIAGATLALLVGGAAPALAADDEPSAEVKTALCAAVSLDLVSGPADAAVGQALATLRAAQDELTESSTGITADVLADVQARIDRIVTALNEEERSDEDRERLHAEQEKLQGVLDDQAAVKAAEDARDAAIIRQRAAVDLEAQVKAFVGDRDYADVRGDVCSGDGDGDGNDDVTTTPTTPPAPPADDTTGDLDCADFPLDDGTTAQEMFDRDSSDPHNLDTDGDNIPCELGQDEVVSDGVAVPVGGVDTGSGW